MKFFLALTSLLLCLNFSATGQNILVNYDVDTNILKVAEPLNLWMDFLKTHDDSLGADYWNAKEVAKYGRNSYFLLEKELRFGMDNFLKLLSHTTIKILSIRKIEDHYKITSLMEFPDEKEGKSNIQYIFHVYAGPEDGQLKLFNPLPLNTRFYLNSSTVGFIRFHYPKSHTFDSALAQKQSDFLLNIAKKFEVPVDTIDYYFAPTAEEIQRIKGLDFVIGLSGEQIPSGIADVQNKIVYSAGLGEYYPHEVIHVLLMPHYTNGHWWLHEGVATYFGMSRGKELDWHLQRLHKYLEKHPEVNLDTMLNLRTVDQFTDYRYVLGGWIVQQAFEKGSYNLAKKLLDSGKTSEDFYAAIEKHLGIKQENLNKVIREDLKVRFGEK